MGVKTMDGSRPEGEHRARRIGTIHYNRERETVEYHKAAADEDERRAEAADAFDSRVATVMQVCALDREGAVRFLFESAKALHGFNQLRERCESAESALAATSSRMRELEQAVEKVRSMVIGWKSSPNIDSPYYADKYANEILKILSTPPQGTKEPE